MIEADPRHRKPLLPRHWIGRSSYGQSRRHGPGLVEGRGRRGLSNKSRQECRLPGTPPHRSGRALLTHPAPASSQTLQRCAAVRSLNKPDSAYPPLCVEVTVVCSVFLLAKALRSTRSADLFHLCSRASSVNIPRQSRGIFTPSGKTAPALKARG